MRLTLRAECAVAWPVNQMTHSEAIGLLSSNKLVAHGVFIYMSCDLSRIIPTDIRIAAPTKLRPRSAVQFFCFGPRDFSHCVCPPSLKSGGSGMASLALKRRAAYQEHELEPCPSDIEQDRNA